MHFLPPSPHPLPPHTVLLLRTQDTDVLLRAAGGKPPLTMQAFTKLVDKVGAPPAPLAAPSTLPPLGPMPNDVGPVDVPALAELGFTGEPSTIFKVRYNDNTCNTALSASPWHALSTGMHVHSQEPPLPLKCTTALSSLSSNHHHTRAESERLWRAWMHLLQTPSGSLNLKNQKLIPLSLKNPPPLCSAPISSLDASLQGEGKHMQSVTACVT